MSIYADLMCLTCNIRCFLGKTIHEDHQPIYYHIGGADEAPNWARPRLNAVLWKFLADHARHDITVAVEGDDLYDEPGDTPAASLGEGLDNDVTFTDYLRGWAGLRGRLPD
jgi:hypothetical protein